VKKNKMRRVKGPRDKGLVSPDDTTVKELPRSIWGWDWSSLLYTGATTFYSNFRSILTRSDLVQKHGYRDIF